jgi:hypothetical protein
LLFGIELLGIGPHGWNQVADSWAVTTSGRMVGFSLVIKKLNFFLAVKRNDWE